MHGNDSLQASDLSELTVVVVSPAMIEARAGVLLEMRSDEFSNFDSARAVYEAMTAKGRLDREGR